MSNEIMRMATGQATAVTRDDRRAAREGNEHMNTVRLAGLQVDGALALAGHVMEGLVELDDYRQRLAKEDVSRNFILAEIEETALQQIKDIQRSLFNRWGL